MPFNCISFEALLSVTTRLVAKMERDVARALNACSDVYGAAKVVLIITAEVTVRPRKLEYKSQVRQTSHSATSVPS